MKKLLCHLFCFTLFLALTTNNILAQEQHNYTDHKPQYRKWQDSYILDKIDYTPSSTIFYFRFVCDHETSGGAIFYPPGGESPWYLKGRGIDKEFDITAVKNIRRNGVLVKENVSKEAFHVDHLSTKAGHTIFSCEVHFGRLDDDMKVADLIEGKGQEFNRKHFNCFNIKLKTWNDKDLGNEADSKKNVKTFEEKYIGTTTSNPLPSPPKEDAPSSKRLHKPQDLVCEELLILDQIKFHDNSTKFKGMIAANATLNIIFNYMKEHPKATVELYGHSDIFGSEERNIELSKQRVIKIQRWLTMYGIKARRINYEWFGSKKPLVKEGSIVNRRVEIKMSCNE
ncbi:OmpA family protein [Aureispira anguillae]|uniref:OmpA family protein n=1 Tax=Aureispira anguillae TaxID=2864201 RepID=A0A915YBE9_9BACT|nr:OmpA family protein [Aureispira anguillae]BDS09943.1 OmpA family protein [Aureispira anguillae]